MKRYGERLSGLPIQSAPTAGFTLQESLIVMVIVALLAAIGAPSLMGFFQRRQLATAQDMVYQGLRATQRDAMQTRQEQQFSIRQRDDHLEWASHSRSIHPSEVNHWMPLIDGVVFSDIDNTLPAAGDVRYVRFNFQGDVQYRLGTVTLQSQSGGKARRCVVVSTLIGAMRRGENHSQANDNGRYCY
jgi:prepilin-type N-terminal cleavage/methylation domain-containing protein